MNAIEISNLSFSYEKNKNVLKNLSLTVLQGENLGVVGSNGSGKTTLFNLICGLLKPEIGKIKVLDKIVKINSFNPLIGYVFQNPDDQLFSVSVIEDICFGPLNIGIPRIDTENKALKLLSEINMLHLKDRPPHHLSLGEKRMVSIASVISLDPKIMFFDEPNSNLDMKSRRRLINYLNTLKITKLISSHDLEFIIETCSKTIILHNGYIEAYGKTKEIFTNKKLMEKCHQEIPWSLLTIKS